MMFELGQWHPVKAIRVEMQPFALIDYPNI